MTRRLAAPCMAAVAAAVCLCAGCGAKPSLSAALPARNELMAELACAPQSNPQRAERAAQLLRHAGLKDVVRQEFHGNEAGCNIIGTLPGRTQDVIVVGAHFDHRPGGTGVIDNWTGVACMVSLAQAMAKAPPQHTFVFAAFDSEEKGQAGSRWYVLQLSAQQKARITAMVNLECLGISTAKVWLTGSADALEQLAAEVAKKENTPVEFRQLHGVTADANSFMAAGIAAITFDSLDLTDFDLIDSPKDRIEAVRPDRLEQHYRFILKYLQALDGQSGPISAANKDRPAPKPKP